MTEKQRLTTHDFSNVWKDNNNILPSGLKIDLVEHLLRQRLSSEWIDAKKQVIEILKLNQYDNLEIIQILDIGCGLGIDLFLVAKEAMNLNKNVRIIGLDQNLTMIEEAKKLYEKEKDQLSNNVSIEIHHGDILEMKYSDQTFDIIRSDITLQHVDLPNALIEIQRVLKINGRLIALEGGPGNIYSSDEKLIEVYDKVLPNRRDGGTATRLQFILPKMNFKILSTNPKPFLQSGEFLSNQDPNWIKIKGMGEMLVTKEILTEEESQNFQKRYIEACETNQILAASILFIIEAIKYK